MQDFDKNAYLNEIRKEIEPMTKQATLEFLKARINGVRYQIEQHESIDLIPDLYTKVMLRIKIPPQEDLKAQLGVIESVREKLLERYPDLESGRQVDAKGYTTTARQAKPEQKTLPDFDSLFASPEDKDRCLKAMKEEGLISEQEAPILTGRKKAKVVALAAVLVDKGMVKPGFDFKQVGKILNDRFGFGISGRTLGDTSKHSFEDAKKEFLSHFKAV